MSFIIFLILRLRLKVYSSGDEREVNDFFNLETKLRLG